MLPNKNLIFILLVSMQIKTAESNLKSDKIKTVLERLVEERKQIALAEMKIAIESMRKELREFKERVESQKLSKLEGKNKHYYDISLYLCEPNTIKHNSNKYPPAENIVSIKYEADTAIERDIANNNSNYTTNMVSDAEKRVDMYVQKAEKNINETYTKFLACAQKANSAKDLHKCKELFKDSYIPVKLHSSCDLFRDYCGTSVEIMGDISIEEIVFAKRQDKK